MPPPLVPVQSGAPSQPPRTIPKPRLIAAGIAAVIVLLVICGSIFEPMAFFGPTKAFICIDFILVGLFVIVGYAINGRPLGVLIDSRNLMSLSRFQMVVWSILILGAFLTYVFFRYYCGLSEVADIGLDPNLWALLGISTASLVGSPLVLSTKTDKTPDPTAVQKTSAVTGETAGQITDNSKGLVYTNTSVSDANIADMFQGDEIGNTTQVDLSKVQMFLFTIVVALSFIWSVRHALAAVAFGVAGLKGQALVEHASTALNALPTLSPGAIALLGISHAGYLSAKSVNHTKIQ